MYSKILIANRGEIACRAIATCQKMGIATVALCSDADTRAKHVMLADEFVCLGGNTSAESYLVIEKIMTAIEQTGAEAVYPGYGFLSENAEFARRLQQAGVDFIGPNVHAIEVMGDKIASKKLAAEAGVNTVPGYAGEIADATEAAEIAADIGYPVMIKASAGGGGKGMRVAYDESECIEGFARARSEAISSFGDGRIFIEKFIEHPRHIEIQVLADGKGNTVYLNERECSIQRRHQKVIEEAPSPFLTPETRAAMGQQACQLADAVDYQSAGTVEFIVDSQQNFYFLEMNTRLQVEHPVTEMITGVDLVEWMIRIANNEALNIQQSEITINGWSIEARIYAEMPERGFLPSTGILSHYIEPQQSDHVRVDSGVVEGSEVSMYYDPMISKLISWGENRAIAIQHLRSAIDQYLIRGVGHNMAFLQDLLGQSKFLSGNITTNFITEQYPEGFVAAAMPKQDCRNAAMIAVYMAIKEQEKLSGLNSGAVYKQGTQQQNWVVCIENNYYQIQAGIDKFSDPEVEFTLEDGRTHYLASRWMLGQRLLQADIDGNISTWQVKMDQARYQLTHNGKSITILPMTSKAAALHPLMPARVPVDTSLVLMSPMPGKLIKLSVAEGDTVEAGQAIAIIEAMKMENQLCAEKAGTIATVEVNEGESLQADQIILHFAASKGG